MNYKFAKSRRGGALIVSPYLDHLGGGERYMLSVAQVLEKLGYTIYFAWDNLQEITNLSTMLGITLSQPALDPTIKNLYTSHNPIGMYTATRPYDVVVYLSDGSIPLLGGRKNILHMQVPFHGVGGRSWQNQLKKLSISSVIVNSHFTQKIVDREYGFRSHVLYPPVEPISRVGNKQKMILSVGRFEPSLNAKKQDVLIAAWRKLSSQMPGWELVLAGASSSDNWLANLRTQAAGLPIRFEINVSHKILSDLYRQASIYWHAAGYGIDEDHSPELTEHFGISTVEAISAGCIPLIVPKGGQPEIVSNPQLHWHTIEELCDRTLSVSAKKEAVLVKDIDISAYSLDVFSRLLKEVIT